MLRFSQENKPGQLSITQHRRGKEKKLNKKKKSLFRSFTGKYFVVTASIFHS